MDSRRNASRLEKGYSRVSGSWLIYNRRSCTSNNVEEQCRSRSLQVFRHFLETTVLRFTARFFVKEHSPEQTNTGTPLK